MLLGPYRDGFFNLAQRGTETVISRDNFRGDLEGLRKGTLDRCKHLFSSRVPGKFQQVRRDGGLK